MGNYPPGTKIIIRTNTHWHKVTLGIVLSDWRGELYYESHYNGEQSTSATYISTLDTLEVVIECSPINLEQNL